MALVLIIDDSTDMLAMLEMFFERRTPHEAILCTSGREGLERAYERPPDIAVVDVMMPGLDGYEVVRRLRANPDTENIGIIILTARGQQVDQQASLEAGADAHMSKPVNMQALVETIDMLLEKRNQVVKETTMVFPVVSLKGGVGVTTIAVNLAALLQQVASTALWDLSPNSGHAALFVGIQPKTHWGTYLENPRNPVMPLLRQHSSGLQVLCAPPVPLQSTWFDEDSAATVLQTLTDNANFVVVDVPPLLDGATRHILRAADHVVLLTGDTPPAIQTTLATLQALREWRSKIMVVRNAAGPGKRLDVKALQRMMRIQLQGNIPYDASQGIAMRKGVPLAMAGAKSPMIAALQGVAQQLLTSQSS
jgi:MinD-like ATPase involved in chromosome partitioning or flagellar assembly